MTKIITESKELYRFLATPGVEVMNLVFASEDVVYISWKRGAEEDVPILRHTSEVIGAYVTPGKESISIATSTFWERMRRIVIRTLWYTFSRKVNHR